MKRFLLTLAVIALAGSALPRSQAADVSFDFFYNNLSDGNWIEVGDYGYCWQPDIAVSSSKWRPYSDGYWAYSDVGWTWVSYEDFGWATYHYGRWVRLSDRGWVWVVGRDNDLEWGPAWVSWRSGGDRIGWAPLPPRGRTIVARGTISGRVDIDFDIGPAYYNFVDVRYIGEPVLRERIYDSDQNVTYINETVNVTNITYENNVVYNYGPDYNAVVARSSRPIPRLTIERQSNVDPSVAIKSGALVKVEGQKLVVAAPTEIKPGAKVAPPAIKEKVASAKIDNGWSGTGAKEQQALKKKIQTEDASKVPTPSASASAAASSSPATSASASVGPATSASPAVPASPSASASVAASASPAASASTSPTVKGKKGASPAAPMSPAASASPGASASTSPTVKGKKGASPAASMSPAASASPALKGAKSKASDKRPSVSPAASASPAASPDLGKITKGKSKDFVKPAVSPSAAPVLTPAAGKPKTKFGSTPTGATSSPSAASPATESQGKARKSEKIQSSATPSTTGGEGQGHGSGKKAPTPDQSAVGGGEGSHGKSIKSDESTSTSAAPAGHGPAAGVSESRKGKPEGDTKADQKAGELSASPTP